MGMLERPPKRYRRLRRKSEMPRPDLPCLKRTIEAADPLL